MKPTVITFKALKRSVLYSEELDIALGSKREQEYFKWFLASLLFGSRISESIAKKTFGAFARARLLTPRKILAAGRDFLVDPVMRDGGYVRYDETKSMQIIRNCGTLMETYRGSLTRLHSESLDSEDLERRLLAFNGVGPVTVNIFLRELRPCWRHADPLPLPVVVQTAERLGLDLDSFNRKTITFTRIEAGVFRVRKAKDLSAIV